MNALLRSRLTKFGVAAAAIGIGGCAGWAVSHWRVEKRIREHLRRSEAVAERYREDSVPAGGRAAYVSAVELIANPEKYSGQRVILSGVWTVGFEHSQFDLQNAAQHFWIWVEPDWDRVNEVMGDFSDRRKKEEQVQAVPSGHVAFRILAEGTFRYRKKGRSLDFNGFGHMGVSEGFFLFDRLFEYECVKPERPNQSPEPTVMSVTPPAGQESRRP